MVGEMVSPSTISLWLSKLGVMAQFVVYLILIGVILWGVYLILIYKYKVLVFEKRGEGAYRVYRTKARKMVDKGVIKFKLFKGGAKFPPPTDNQIYMEKNKDFFVLFKDVNNFYFPVSFRNPSVELKAMDNNVIDWMCQEFKRSAEIYDKQSFFEKYGHIMVQMVFVGAMFIIFLILLNKMDAVAQALSGIPSQIQVQLVGSGGGGAVVPPS